MNTTSDVLRKLAEDDSNYLVRDLTGKPAVKLMTTMFAAIAENRKLTTAEALRQAMLAIMDDRTNPEWANPTSWAPFVLVGDGGIMTRLVGSREQATTKRRR